MKILDVTVNKSALVSVNHNEKEKYLGALKALQTALKKNSIDEFLKKSPIEGHYEFNHGNIKIGGLVHKKLGEFNVKFFLDQNDAYKIFTPARSIESDITKGRQLDIER